MAQHVVSAELIRDGQCTPWGFRLTGGADVGAPLTIQRVFLGSPSEGELKRADMIVKIRDKDASKMTHKEATDLISKAGNNIKLVVLRIPGAVPVSPPASPIPIFGAPGTPVTVYHLTASTTSSNATFPVYPTPPGSEHLFKPLPTTQFPDPQSASRNAALQQANEALREKVAITNQPYRSVPLILPGVKATKDVPVGSYLRHSTDTFGRHDAPSNPSQRVNDAYMLNKVQEAVKEAATYSPSVSSGRTPTPDSMANGPQYLRQYNSPINMYSNQAIMETMASQTAAATKEHDDAGRTLSPKPPIDISKSPTYQMIHEEEWKNLDKKSLKEQPPVQERVHHVVPPVEGGSFGLPHKIYQSGSFNTLMTSMQGLTDF